MGLFIRKSIRLSKHTRLNLSKSGIGISTGIKGARIGINSKGKTYVAGGKDGVYFRKELNNKATTNVYTKEQLLGNEKLLREHNSKITNKAVMKLIKKSLIWFFILAIADAAIFKSNILLWVIAIGVNLVCWTTMFSLIKKWWKANKDKKLLN